MKESGGSKLLIVAATVALLGGGVAVWLSLRDREAPPPVERKTTHFRESATEAGLKFQMRFLPNEQGETFKINLYDHGCGLAVGDYDGDGFDDIYFLNQLGPNALYRNRGDGTFEDVTLAAGVALDDRVCVGATFADYDNDGRQDLYVTSTRGGNVLFRNQGNGTFQDVTRDAGLTHIGHSQTALFFDYDGDGFLDLYLTNTAQWTTDEFDRATGAFVGKGKSGLGTMVRSPKEQNVLYRNNGNGTFTDVTARAGVPGHGWAGDAIAFDYNDDHKLDILVTCMFGRALLYRNNGNGTFTDVALQVLGRTPWGGVGAKVFDYNNDGRLDVFIVDMHSDMWMGVDRKHESVELAFANEKRKFRYYNGPIVDKDPSLIDDEKLLGQLLGFTHDEVLFGNACYRNDGGGKFTEVSDQVGLETFWPWGIATGDFDNDGLEDIFLPSGMGYPFYYWPNALLMNQGDGTFREMAEAMGVEPPARGKFLAQPILGKDAARSSRCAAVADFVHDGRLSMVVNNFNDAPYFFKNQGKKRNFVDIRLRGTRSNRDAVGAVVRLHQGKRIMTRQVHGAGGYLAQSSRTLHFGLGDEATIDRVEITWPDGLVQRIDNIEVNMQHEFVEPAAKRDPR